MTNPRSGRDRDHRRAPRPRAICWAQDRARTDRKGRDATMIRRFSKPAAGGLAAAVGTLTVVVGMAAAQPTHRPARTQVAADQVVLASQKCGKGVERPTVVVFACGDFNSFAEHLRWWQWGGRVALGSGDFSSNDCKPDCARGHFHEARATVRLYSRRHCAGHKHLYYQRATVVVRGRRQAELVGCPVLG